MRAALRHCGASIDRIWTACTSRIFPVACSWSFRGKSATQSSNWNKFANLIWWACECVLENYVVALWGWVTTVLCGYRRNLPTFWICGRNKKVSELKSDGTFWQLRTSAVPSIAFPIISLKQLVSLSWALWNNCGGQQTFLSSDFIYLGHAASKKHKRPRAFKERLQNNELSTNPLEIFSRFFKKHQKQFLLLQQNKPATVKARSLSLSALKPFKGIICPIFANICLLGEIGKNLYINRTS